MRILLMSMHNPPHPGEFITNIYLEPNGISGRELAEKLGAAPSTADSTVIWPPIP
jgi:plasmid maintenance system antidote protein VapI